MSRRRCDSANTLSGARAEQNVEFSPWVRAGAELLWPGAIPRQPKVLEPSLFGVRDQVVFDSQHVSVAGGGGHALQIAREQADVGNLEGVAHSPRVSGKVKRSFFGHKEAVDGTADLSKQIASRETVAKASDRRACNPPPERDDRHGRGDGGYKSLGGAHVRVNFTSGALWGSDWGAATEPKATTTAALPSRRRRR